MVRKKKDNARALQGLFVLAVIASGIAAFMAGSAGTINPRSQVAVGAEADAMCASTRADAKCQCNKGIDPQTGQCSQSRSGGGKIGCPCYDRTAGEVAASGQCAQVGKCLATEAGGKPPMLPMLPMPMPMPKMPMPEMPCPPTMPSSTPGTSVPGLEHCNRAGLWTSVSSLLDENASTTPREDGDEDEATTTIASSTEEVRQTLVRFLESVGIFQEATTTGDVGEIEGVPFRVVLERDDAGHLRLEVGAASSTGGSTSSVRAIVRTDVSGESTFFYAEAEPEATVFSRVVSTFQRVLDTIWSWFQ